MQINAINPLYSTNTISRNKKISPQKVHDISGDTANFNNFAVISFKGGNKDQVIYWGMELRPYNKKGGISTVLDDHRGLKAGESSVIPKKKSIDYWKQPDKVFVDPFFNGMEMYDYETGLMQEAFVEKIPEGLKADSAFKQFEGEYFTTNDPNFKKYANALDFFNNEEKIVAATGKPKLQLDINIHILKQVGEPIKMDFGGDNGGETEIKLFRDYRYDAKAKKLVAINDFKVFTDVHATHKGPYEQGGYSTSNGALAQTWKGDADARGSKAFVELMERICKEVSKDGKAFDPATVLLNDAHAGNVVEYMAQKAAKGDSFFEGKKPELIIHNGGSGYIQKTSYMNMFINIADKELRDAVRHDPDFIDAMLKGSDAVDQYFAKILPNEIIDAQGGVSPFQNTLYYAEKGYVPKVVTVSEGYFDASVKNRDIVSGQYEILKRLAQQDVYAGITNGSTGINPYSLEDNPYFKGYTFPSDLKEAEKVKGKTLTALRVFDEKKAGKGVANFDINHVWEVKQHNKAALLERFDEDVIEALKAMQYVKDKQYDYASVMASDPGRKVEILGHIDKKLIASAKDPKNNVKLLVSWGRGDTQKGLDSVLRSFRDYVENFGDKDPNVVLVAGGEIPDGAEGEKLRSLIEIMDNNPKTKGRFVFMNGFAPNKPLIMSADFAVLPSRFAPCELTDLEAMRGLCSPIVTNCQGLAQKNFDPDIAAEAAKATSYKTKQDFYMSLDEIRSLLKPEDKEKFEKEFKAYKDEIAQEYKHKYNKTISDAEIMEKIFKEKHYDFIFNLTRPYRDKIIEAELVDAYERALQKDYHNENQAKMIKNGVNMGIGWEDNSGLSKYNKSSGELYREAFKLDNKPVKEEDTLLYKLRQNCTQIIEKYKNKVNNESTAEEPVKDTVSFWGKCKKWAKSRTGKWTLGIAAGAAGISLISYAGYKAGWLDPKFAEEKKNGSLSRIG